MTDSSTTVFERVGRRWKLGIFFLIQLVWTSFAFAEEADGDDDELTLGVIVLAIAVIGAILYFRNRRSTQKKTDFHNEGSE